jgi:hypothetical protein
MHNEFKNFKIETISATSKPIFDAAVAVVYNKYRDGNVEVLGYSAQYHNPAIGTEYIITLKIAITPAFKA